MILLDILDLSLPLTNPIIKFLLILVIILFAPIVLDRIKIPHLLGLIIAGAIIGPHGFNLMERDSSIILSGTAGLLYIMFLAGLEMDMGDFKKNSGRSIVFGLYTFIIPMALGIFAGFYVLGFTMPTSILLASMFASHTLIAYPIISKYGLVKNNAVNVAVGGTIITDTLALLVLAVIIGMTKGEVNEEFWIRLSASVIIFGLVVTLIFPLIARRFLKSHDDRVSQYIFVLVMVFLGAVLAEIAGIEAIIGAFLTGLALNRLIPATSPLMNRIEFVGNAIFIPFFLIGVGMLIDFRMFFKDFQTIYVAIVMIIVATSAKYAAAWLTQKTFRYSDDQRRLIFGLSNAQAAATLAAVLVGYNTIVGQTETGEDIRLLSESVLNGTILMILVTCTIASVIAQKGAQNIAFLESTQTEDDNEEENREKILIAISTLETTEELVNLGVTVKSKRNKKDIFALSIVNNENPSDNTDKQAKKILNLAARTAAATDNHLQELLRYDSNIVNGIASVVREHRISDLILGLHKQKGISDSFLGNLSEGILKQCNTTTLIYKPQQNFGTIKRHVVIIPENAEKEIGFAFWLVKVWNIARNSGAKLVFFGNENVIKFIQAVHKRHPVEAKFKEFTEWEDFLILAKEIKKDDNLIIVMSREGKLSYQENMVRIPLYLNNYFADHSFILIYPIQAKSAVSDSMNLTNASFVESLEKLDEIGKTVVRLFRRK